MKLDINFDQDDVKDQLVQAIMDSAIGKEIEESIQKALGDSGAMYNPSRVVKDAIQKSLRMFVEDIAIAELKKKEDKVRKLVQEQITDEAMKDMIESVFKKW